MTYFHGDEAKFFFFLIFLIFLLHPHENKSQIMDGTQFLILWWFTAKNESGNDRIA